MRGLSLDYGKNGPVIDFASSEPNRFGPPSGFRGEAGQGPVDQSNLWAPFELDTGEKRHSLGNGPAVLLVRPRGWHLPERHLVVDGEPISGSLFDLDRKSVV